MRRILGAVSGAALLAGATFMAGGSPAAAATTTIDFDESSAPEVFADASALRDAYAAQGITFSGPDEDSGGAVLDEESAFDVSGYSSPNFLAFNIGSSFPGGGRPMGPERMDFASPVKALSMFAASAGDGTATLNAYDELDNLVDSFTLTLSSTGGQLEVAASSIAWAELSFTTTTLVVDDLAFQTNEPPVADAGADQAVTIAGGPVEVSLDGTGSTDPDSDALTYTWTGGFEGGTTTGPTPIVTFAAAGTYTITLEVSDGSLTATDTVDVVVSVPTTTTSTTAPPTPAAGGATPVVAQPSFTG